MTSKDFVKEQNQKTHTNKCSKKIWKVLSQVVLFILCFKISGCQVYGFVGAMAGFISINTLTMIAIERFFVIVIREPYRHIRTSNRTVLVAIVFIWVYSFMWAICPLIGWGSFILEGSMTSCTFDFFSRDVNTKSYVASILVFCFTVQLFLIICSYVRIYLKVLQHEKEIVNCYVDGNDTLKIQNRKVKKFHSVHVKTAKISLVIISIFCLSWTPYAVIAIIGNFGDASVITPLASTIPGVFAKLSTVLNPMIYALLHPKFRNKLPFQKKKVLKTKINFQALMKLDNESPLQTSSSMSAPFDAATPMDCQKETMVWYETLWLCFHGSVGMICFTDNKCHAWAAGLPFTGPFCWGLFRQACTIIPML